MKNVEKQEKEYSIFQYFIFVFLIPLLFTITIASIILSVAGVNVSKEAKKIASHVPYVQKWVKPTKPVSEKEQLKNANSKLKLANLKTESEIKKLQQQTNQKDEEITNLRIDAEKLRQQIKDLQSGQSQKIASDQRKLTLSKKLFSSYEQMSPKQASQILSVIPENEAFYIISNLKNENVSEILSNMDVKKAARITTMLTNNVK
jgi:flagellar motility protein MotE (MotC chaperone)